MRSLTASALRQMDRDMARDEVIVNNVLVAGGSHGDDGMMERIFMCIKQCAMESRVELDVGDCPHCRELASGILCKASRSNSGGAALLFLQEKLRGTLRFVAAADLARPIIIRAFLGEEDGKTAIVLQCITTSFFKMSTNDDADVDGGEPCTPDTIEIEFDDGQFYTPAELAGCTVALQYHDNLSASVNFSNPTRVGSPSWTPFATLLVKKV